MTNPLTGDHDVVLQVSVGTLNRLLAALHQNAMVNPPVLPTIPHSAFVRVGDDPAHRVDGVHGVARVQSGVPQLELIHRSQDRVRVRVPLRAWFTPSSGSAHFPEFTYGTLRAEFGLQELAAVGTPGPHIGPSFYLPPRYVFDVDPRTVAFTSFGATSHDAAIARQAVALLQTVFASAGGQPMLQVLMQRKLISLVGADGSQVVAIGVEVGPGAAAIEQPRNISKVLTAGQDLAIAVSKEFALSLLQPQLDALRQYHPVVHFSALFVSADYTIDFTPGIARWGVDTTTVAGATVPCGALDLTIDGRARTTSVLPDCTFTIRDRLLVAFNPATQLLLLTRKGSPNVQAHVGSGIGIAESVVEAKIAQQYNSQIDSAIAAAVPKMADAAFMQEVIDQQLKLSDDQASTRLESAEFSNDGVVLHGKVSFSPRQRGSVQFGALNDLSGYGAFLSWFPGGRITAFAWKWMPPPPAPTGTTLDRVVTDRFVFQPPEGMPGLPPPSGGSTVGGRVCLYIQGRVIDPTTGAEVDAVVGDCYSVPDPPPLIIFPIFVAAEQAKRITEPLWMRMGTDPEVGIVDAARGKEEMPLTNTLICLLGSGSTLASLAIAEGIDRAGREDAGLVVLVVVPEGALDEGAATMRESGPEREAPIHVIEDVGGSWVTAFASALDSGPSFRLVGVDGRLVWSFDGTLDAETLAEALRENLQPSGAPGLVPLRPGPPIGRRLAGLEPRITEDEIIAAADQPLTICFALEWAASSRRQIHRLNERAASEEDLIVVVLADTGAAEAAEFAQSHAPQLIVIPDPDRSITAGYDVWLWPTTLSVAVDGTVISITTGWHPFDEEAPVMAAPHELMGDL